MTAQEIRSKYLNYFQKNGHAVIPRAQLVPQEDATTLFTGSGMQPLIPYLLGEEHPEGTRLVDSQTCLRAEDIEEVGDNRHTTFFEMLGNWSLGDYFKKEQIPWFWAFLTEEIGLDPARIFVTCFIGEKEFNIPKDEESAELWEGLFKKSGITHGRADIGSEEDGGKRGIKDDERIFFYDSSKNWWSRSGKPANMPEGEPGGADSEMFYLFPEVQHDPAYGEKCHVNCDCGRFIELGNSVFMEYVRTKDGFEKLPKQNVDYGGGLERIAAASNNSPDVFTISLLKPIVEQLELASGKSYAENTQPMRIIADHMRAACWLGVDGIVPSNNEQGYVMRRLVRRAIRAALDLGIHSDLMGLVVETVLDQYKDDYPEVAEQSANVLKVLQKEEQIFRQTLKSGVRMFKKEVDGKLTGTHIFKLYDTYGFPVELSLEEATKYKIAVDDAWQSEFDNLMAEQKERSRTATKGQFKGGLGGHDDIHKKYHTATHLMYRALREVLGDHVLQRGSNITPDRLRFDFEHTEKMTPEQIKQVEDIVNKRIEMDLSVSWEEIPTEKALKDGAYGAFGDKYGDTVKVYSMKDKAGKAYSFEICGGPHVEQTSKLAEDGKKFKIKKEQSSSAGVRRIKAVLL